MNIWNSLINLAVTVITFVIGVFPNASTSITNEISGGLAGFKTLLGTINWFFPVDTLLTIITMVISVEVGLFSIKVLRWAINAVLPFIKV